MGDEELCSSFIDTYKESIRAFYIRKDHKPRNRFLSVPPTFLCIILGKGKSGRAFYFSDAIEYSEKSKCHIYVVCSPDQFDGIRNAASGCSIDRISLIGLHKLIKETIQHFKDSPDSELETIKSRFDSVSVISADPALAAFCESQLSFNSINQRVIINMDSANASENELNGYLITESPDGNAPAKLKQIAESLPETKIPAVYIGTKEKVRVPKSITYISLNSGNNSIKAHFRKYHRKNLRLISYEK